MFLMYKPSGVLIEVMDLSDLINPCHSVVIGRAHAGEEMQDPDQYLKVEMLFPSGEELPRCWLDAHYREIQHSAQQQLLAT
jgi:hypothetical protein